MNTPDLALGAIWYIVFLFSTTCHEAAHALVAKMGGDLTAAEGGQVTLNPIPHIRRSPFGMVVVPIVSFAAGWLDDRLGERAIRSQLAAPATRAARPGWRWRVRRRILR